MTDPERWGIAPGHHHVRGEWVPAPQRGVEAALAAMGASGTEPQPPPTWVIRRDDGLHLPWAATLETEDGGSTGVAGHVPPEGLPLGYHRLVPADGGDPVRLIVSPGVCPLPPRMWGWAVQLYAARSRGSWGIGDLADLRRLTAWSEQIGAGMLLINPLHAVAPTPGQQASPYFPGSRRWRNPIYLRVEEVPGAASVEGMDELARLGRALDADRRIDRDEVWRLKRAALALVWSGTRVDPRFDRWLQEQGRALEGFATWCALADEHGPDFRRWPCELRRHDAPAVAVWSAAHGDRIRFHAWLQWLVATQLDAARRPSVALMTDLAIGADPAGADAWQWQDVIAQGVSVGAPPDDFSPGGQDWGFPPFDPWRLRAAGYAPFADVVRAAVGDGGAVRVDHVAGLFRLFWVPSGSTPADGVYVMYPWRDLLGVLALEASRAGAFCVGEDLGTVEPWSRDALAEANVLSYRLLWFEERPPSDWPEKSLAAVTTHDLPTISGVWTGEDLRARRSLPIDVDEDSEHGLRRRLESVAGEDGLAAGDVVCRAYAALASAPSLLVSATLDDALEVDERPNQPGTTDEWPNWSLALPAPLEDIETDPRVEAVAAVLREGRGG